MTRQFSRYGLYAGFALVMAGGMLTQAGQINIPYDLIFRTGTLDDLSQGTVLRYRQTIKGSSSTSQNQQTKTETSAVELTLEADLTARLTLWQGKKFRHIGDFSADIGNPLIMYFVETIVHDTANNTGGSPFYIRNRVKEALIRPATITEAQIRRGGTDLPMRQIELRPFVGDTARARMGKFADLSIHVSVSEQIPGWYHALEARIDSDTVAEAPYRVSLQLEEQKHP